MSVVIIQRLDSNRLCTPPSTVSKKEVDTEVRRGYCCWSVLSRVRGSGCEQGPTRGDVDPPGFPSC